MKLKLLFEVVFRERCNNHPSVVAGAVIESNEKAFLLKSKQLSFRPKHEFRFERLLKNFKRNFFSFSYIVVKRKLIKLLYSELIIGYLFAIPMWFTIKLLLFPYALNGRGDEASHFFGSGPKDMGWNPCTRILFSCKDALRAQIVKSKMCLKAFSFNFIDRRLCNEAISIYYWCNCTSRQVPRDCLWMV